MPANPSQKLKLAAAALCAVALVASGCGGSSYKSEVENAAKELQDKAG